MADLLIRGRASQGHYTLESRRFMVVRRCRLLPNQPPHMVSIAAWRHLARCKVAQEIGIVTSKATNQAELEGAEANGQRE